jgi:hypothetical protein
VARVLPIGGGVLSVVVRLREGQGTCKRLLADRWSLLMPTTQFECAGSPFGAWDVTVTGVLAGHAVSRAYSGCHGATGLRWARFLGIAR